SSHRLITCRRREWRSITVACHQRQQHCGSGCREHRVVERRLEAEGDCHGGAEQDEQHSACEACPPNPKPEYQSESKHKLRNSCCPRQKPNCGGGHERVHLGRVPQEVLEISIADVLAVEPK